MPPSDISRQLAQIEAEMTLERTQRDNFLAREREELSFDAVADMHNDLGGLCDGSGKSLSKIEALEMSLIHEKRTVAEMEEALSEAKAHRLMQRQLTKVGKHHKFLEQMMGQLQGMSQREVEEKRKWEKEWTHRMDSFKQQHFELQQGLEKKQLAEMRRLQLDFRRKIKKLDDDLALMKSKGTAPSPRALMKVQDENATQVVLLFQKHAQERAHLVQKVGKQENLLMQSRSQSLDRLFTEAHTKSENLIRRFNPGQTIKLNRGPGMILDDTARHKLHSSAVQGMQKEPSKITVRSPPDRKTLHSSRASSRRLPSPRLDVSNKGGDMTFCVDYFLSDEGEYENESEQIMDSSRASVPPSRMTRTVSFDEDGTTRGRDPRDTSHLRSSARSTSRASTSQGFSSMHTIKQQGASHHNHSFGDQTSLQQQYSTKNSLNRPLYPGAHGRIGKDEYEDMLPMPGTEATGWKSMEKKNDNQKAFHARGTDSGEIRPAFITQVVAPQYRDSSAKGTVGSIAHLGGDKRLQKASGAAYLVPFEKLGLGRTLPTVRARTKAEKEERRRKAGHSVLDPVSQHPKSPDWGTVSLSKRQVTQRQPDSAAHTESPVHDQVRRVKAPKDETPPPVVKSRQEAQPPSEKFSQLESWVEEKIRAILYHQGPPAKPDSAQGGNRKLSSSQGGRPMHSSTSTAQTGARPESSGGLPALARIPSASSTTPNNGDSTIGKMLMRLKTTMATDEELAVPTDKRKARPPSLSSVEPISGMRYEDPRVIAADTKKERELQTGAQVQQVYDDFEMKDEDRGAPWSLSNDAQERRGRLEQLDASNATLAVTPFSHKTPKRVGFSETLDTQDAFRPETGWSEQSGAVDRPETGASSWAGDPGSRPTTGRTSSAMTQETDFPNTTEEDDGIVNDTTGATMHEDFFPKVRHNKVAEVEDALAAGFPVDARDPNGNTALIVACQNGHKRLAKLCLKYGANPDNTNHQGNTALHYAVGYGYQPLAKYIISHGGDDTVMNLQGKTPYEMNK